MDGFQQQLLVFERRGVGSWLGMPKKPLEYADLQGIFRAAGLAPSGSADSSSKPLSKHSSQHRSRLGDPSSAPSPGFKGVFHDTLSLVLLPLSQ
ncbi:hypothetical protein QFC19_009207 [Naganishia cerealis]|uniref:Uncharacterized protein n=1 Tax=Naganishia cerealis TaxID=610337 RepID=A0ACC2UXK7_9TREE|nr:hypothetical protein QFC19_009207 [Naganishia cerealis]